VTSVTAGNCTIAANQAGDVNYTMAPQITQTIVITAIQNDTTPPTLVVSTLPNGAVTNQQALNISGTVSDIGSGVMNVTVNGQLTTITNGSFSSVVTLIDGANTVTIIATDNVSNSSTDNRAITLDRTAPTVTVTAPADNSVTNATFTAVSGGTNDPTATVVVKINGGSAANATMNGSSFDATLNLVAGMNTIEIIATDQVGNISSSKRTITSDTTVPTLSVTNPVQDISTAQSNVTLVGTVIDPITTSTVTIVCDGVPYSPAVAADGSFSQNLVLVTPKTYTVVVTAADQAGNTATVLRNIVKTISPSGDINGDGVVDIADALKILRISVGLDIPTADNYVKADVAPLQGGVPAPDGVIDIGDALVILEKTVKLYSW
jgi:hypothetical protein